MIKRFGLIAALACLTLATGCTQPSASEPPAAASEPPAAASNGSSAAPSPIVALVLDERLLFAAEAAYNVPAHAYVTADANGQLPPSLKAQLKPVLVNSYAKLQDARRLYALGNAVDFETAAKAAKSLANSAKCLMPASMLPAGTERNC